MDTIDVSDLPEHYAQAIAKQVEDMRRELAEKKQRVESGTVPELPHWNLGATGTFSRKEIYGDIEDI